jgi:hypothetical protein
MDWVRRALDESLKKAPSAAASTSASAASGAGASAGGIVLPKKDEMRFVSSLGKSIYRLTLETTQPTIKPGNACSVVVCCAVLCLTLLCRVVPFA